MKKIKVVFVAVLCLITLLAASLASAAEESKQTVLEAYGKLDAMKSYHMTMMMEMTMAVQGKDMKTIMNGEMDFQVQPFVCKNNMDISISVDGKELQKQPMLQYMEISEQKLNTYTYMDGKWQRLSMPGGDNFVRQYGDYIKAIKSASLISEDETTAVYEITEDSSYLKDVLKNSLESLGMSKLNISDDLIASLGDLTYTVKIDKTAGIIAGMDMELSELMAAIGNQMAAAMPAPASNTQELRDMFKNAKMQVHITMSQFDGIAPIIIPDEARGGK
jgi:hypothetical protein